MKRHFVVLTILTVLSYHSYAQEEIPLINSGELIQQGIALADSGLNKKAIALYDKISRNDTNYVQALYQKAVCLAADSQYTESIKYCRLALSLKEQRNFEPDIYNQYGNVLDAMGDFEHALQVYDSGIQKYPAYSLLHYNKGIVFLEQSQYAKAEEIFKKTLLLNPYQYSAHFNLGIVALAQGKIIPAYMSFMGYLLMTPSGRYKSRCIKIMDEIAKADDDVLEFKNKRTEGPGESYQLSEEILLSKIALDKQYKPIIQLDDPISRQIQVLFEKLDFNEGDQDFWMQYYLPYFKQVFNGKFELFINHIFSDVDVKVIKEFNRKNKKEMEAFLKDAATYFDLIKTTRELQWSKRAHTETRYLLDNGLLQGKGKLTDNGEMEIGPWEFYYPGGNIKAKGLLNNAGKREGDWNFYFFSGKLKAKEHYVNGDLEGKQVSYFENGQLATEKYFAHDTLNGSYSEYFVVGSLRSQVNYKNGLAEGIKKEYYSGGGVRATTTYVHSVENGPYFSYYQNGQKYDSAFYKDGKLEGNFKAYYENGVLMREGSYVKDQAEGEWKTYYPGGQLKEKMNFSNGKLEGAYEEYFENGQLLTKYINKKGKTAGAVPYYDKDGKLYSTVTFEKDIIKSANYLDKSGREIANYERKDKLFRVLSYTPMGEKFKDNTYNEKGETNGEEIGYFRSGDIYSKVNYENGVLKGPYQTFYSNGNKRVDALMEDDKKNGFYKDYFAHGQLQSMGWYTNDELNGEWRYFDEQGHLTSVSYFLNNELSGYKELFWINGKKYMEIKSSEGWLTEMTQYDTLGNILRKDSFPGGSGKYVLVYPNGKKSAEGEFVHGNLSGKYVTYYCDGSIQSTRYYKAGDIDSTYRYFYLGGKKNTEGQYSYGKKTGAWKRYDEDEHLTDLESYVLDNFSGKQFTYNENGKLEFESIYKEGDRQGPARKYDPDGTLMYEITYEGGGAKSFTYLNNNSQPVTPIIIKPVSGELKTYYPNGSVSREFSFVNGVLHGKDILYYKNGKQMSYSVFKNGVKEGPWLEYYSSGQLKSESTYLHDNLNGVYKKYSETGKLEREENYINGTLHGKSVKYDATGKVKQTLIYYYGDMIEIK